MAGLLPNEGENLVANLLFKNTSVDRGTNLQLGLFTNSTIGETITEALITEPTGGGYARKTLTDASWTVVNDLASYAIQTFLATGSDYTGVVYGYFICTLGTTKRIIAIEANTVAGGVSLIQGDSYTVTPQILVA
jgi:hypothetical protein